MSFKWTNRIAGALGVAVFIVILGLDVFHEGFAEWMDHVDRQMGAPGSNSERWSPVFGLFCMAGLVIGGAIGFVIDMVRFQRDHRDPQRDPFSPWQDLE
jgi:divalent metal cation (Fe/Co/Zn/Cd) transporter